MPRYRLTNIAKGASEIETPAGMQLSNMVAIQLLPRGMTDRWRLERFDTAAFPFRLWHQGIDSSRIKIHSNAIACEKTRKSATGVRFWRCI